MTAQKQTTAAPSLFAKSDSGEGSEVMWTGAVAEEGLRGKDVSKKKEKKKSKDYVNI